MCPCLLPKNFKIPETKKKKVEEQLKSKYQSRVTKVQLKSLKLSLKSKTEKIRSKNQDLKRARSKVAHLSKLFDKEKQKTIAKQERIDDLEAQVNTLKNEYSDLYAENKRQG